jgi:hypothetical protein
MKIRIVHPFEKNERRYMPGEIIEADDKFAQELIEKELAIAFGGDEQKKEVKRANRKNDE